MKEENTSEDYGTGSTDLAKLHTELVEQTDGLLLDARSGHRIANTRSLPIAQLSALGAGVASLIPALRTVTQTTAIDASGMYRLANESVGDTLKLAQNGNFWGAFNTAEGASKFVQLQPAAPLTATTQTVAAINPATLMMAAALFSVEQKLDEIVEMQKQILSFLETEKESEIEADVETLSGIVANYKINWDNEHFVSSNHKLVLDIQRTARKNMLGYQKNVSEIIKSRKLIVLQMQVNATLQDLLKKFKYYRLSLYTFSMASMMEIMLSGNFKEEYITGIKDEVDKLSDTYSELFVECSVYLEKMANVSVETNVLKGLGSASKAMGKFIGSVSAKRGARVDGFLQDSGTQMKESANRMENETQRAFDEISSPKTRVFVERMEDLIQIYNHTEQICFDDEKIYLFSAAK